MPPERRRSVELAVATLVERANEETARARAAAAERAELSAALQRPLLELIRSDSGGFGTGDPMEVSWTMLPGHFYEFNVGQWARVERHPRLGGAGGISQIQGTVILMTLFR
jgi:hypothetical protein